jgi:hypothetical protein
MALLRSSLPTIRQFECGTFLTVSYPCAYVLKRIHTKAPCMTTRPDREPMWKQLKLRRCLSTYSKTPVDDRLHPNAPFPVIATIPVSNTVFHPVPQAHNLDHIDISYSEGNSNPVRDLNNFLQVRALVPWLKFASVQTGPHNQAVHTGTYTCEPISTPPTFEFELPTRDTNFDCSSPWCRRWRWYWHYESLC